MDFIIQSAAAPNAPQFTSIKEAGYDSIEIHMDSVDIASAFTLVKEFGFDCHTVHAPARYGRMLYVDDLAFSGGTSAIISTCQLAYKMSELYNHPVGVVIHNRLNVTDYDKILNCVAEKLQFLHSVFPEIHFLIENEVPMDMQGRFKNGCLLGDTRKVCSRLNTLVGDECFYICADLCHLRTTATFYSFMYDSCSPQVQSQIDNEYATSVSKQVIQNLDMIRNIHVSDAHGLGQDSETHAMPLSSTMYIEFTNILKNAKLQKDGQLILTAEVNENDYSKCINAKEMLDVMHDANKLASEALGMAVDM